MRKALCVGIDFYPTSNHLGFCVSDATSVAEALSRHENGKKNFDVACLLAPTVKAKVYKAHNPSTGEVYYDEKVVDGTPVLEKELKYALKELFDPDQTLEVALFYFAGHGYVDSNCGYLCTSDIGDISDGVSLDDVMKLASHSKATNKIIILDSCHSGYAGKADKMHQFSILPENTVIMASCTQGGTAGDGCFTPLMVDALEGGAINLMGEVSPGSIYAYIDRALGTWDQRPVFKANVENFVCLRENTPPIELEKLREITEIFPERDKDKTLDPGYEEDKRTPVKGFEEHDLEKERIMKILRKYHSQNLVVPVDVPYMYDAAMKSKSCRLTALGKYYWNLVKENRI